LDGYSDHFIGIVFEKMTQLRSQIRGLIKVLIKRGKVVWNKGVRTKMRAGIKLFVAHLNEAGYNFDY